GLADEVHQVTGAGPGQQVRQAELVLRAAAIGYQSAKNPDVGLHAARSGVPVICVPQHQASHGAVEPVLGDAGGSAKEYPAPCPGTAELRGQGEFVARFDVSPSAAQVERTGPQP